MAKGKERVGGFKPIRIRKMEMVAGAPRYYWVIVGKNNTVMAEAKTKHSRKSRAVESAQAVAVLLSIHIPRGMKSHGCIADETGG